MPDFSEKRHKHDSIFITDLERSKPTSARIGRNLLKNLIDEDSRSLKRIVCALAQVWELRAE